jgi:hypothetical protein
MADEVKKCLVCAMSLEHNFRDCFSQECECGCLEEIRGKIPLTLDQMPRWFRNIPLKAVKKFNRAHTKKGY